MGPIFRFQKVFGSGQPLSIFINFFIVICISLLLTCFTTLKIQKFISILFFLTFIITYCNWTIGTFDITEENAIRGITSYSLETIETNFFLNDKNDESILSIFSIIFPGFIGTLTSTIMNDHQNSRKNIIAEIFCPLLTIFIIYFYGIFVVGFTILRNADGMNLTEYDNFTKIWKIPQCVENNDCHYGLANYHQVSL